MITRNPTFRPLRIGVALACTTLPLAASAATYTVDVQPTLNDLPITIEPVPFDGRLVMKLTNGGQAKVRCDLRYDASPQPIRRSYVYLKPGETAENSFQAKRKWYSVTVGVTCKPTDK
ncbi:MAG: hypothetical protein FIB04_03080 [Gammaproteobacteria bacterium]|nr:hypothetical protein [Gammaproteobacteria bacterium]